MKSFFFVTFLNLFLRVGLLLNEEIGNRRNHKDTIVDPDNFRQLILRLTFNVLYHFRDRGVASKEIGHTAHKKESSDNGRTEFKKPLLAVEG